MYISVTKLFEVRFQQLPEDVRNDSRTPMVSHVCISEYGDLVLVDDTADPHRYWDPHKRRWCKCSPDSIMLRFKLEGES